MADRPPSPFAGLGNLDKQLLRPTRREQPAPASSDAPEEASVPARTHARTPLRKRARADAPADPLDDLVRRLAEKQHQASSTFRYRSDELTELDAVFAEVKQAHRTISKNDIVRLGLAWLLDDYRRNKDDSVLAQVLARM